MCVWGVGGGVWVIVSDCDSDRLPSPIMAACYINSCLLFDCLLTRQILSRVDCFGTGDKKWNPDYVLTVTVGFVCRGSDLLVSDLSGPERWHVILQINVNHHFSHVDCRVVCGQRDPFLLFFYQQIIVVISHTVTHLINVLVVCVNGCHCLYFT